jgi:hypothetical protein
VREVHSAAQVGCNALAYSSLRRIVVVSYAESRRTCSVSLRTDLMVTLRAAITRDYALGLRLM